MESRLPEAYRRAFIKRIQEREAGIREKPSGLSRDEQDAYNDADIAYNAKNSVNSSVKSKSPKYRKAYHERRLKILERDDGEIVYESHPNSEIEQAIANAENSATTGNIIPDDEEALMKQAEVELASVSPTPSHLIFNNEEITKAKHIYFNNEGNPFVKAKPGIQVAKNEEELVFNESGEEVTGEAKEKLLADTTTVKVSNCETLYDPCTKEPLPDLAALEKRVRELKKKQNTASIGLFGLKNNTSNFDFLTKVFINSTISLDDMVSFRLAEGGQVGSDIFEVLSRLFVYFGGIEGVSLRDDGNYKFMKKIEGSVPEIYPNATEALKKMECKATRKMGISDITLTLTSSKKVVSNITAPYCESTCDVEETTEMKTYLMSVKWYKEEKNAEHYDLEKLFTAAQTIVSAEQKPVSIIVFLKSKRDFEIAHNRSFRQYVKEIGNTFFGWNEDVKPFLQEIRRSIFEQAEVRGITPLQALESQYFTKSAKPVLSLQLHQDIIVKGLCDSLETNEDMLYLVGVLPRGGKTYIAGGILREYQKRKAIENLNIFWITAAPSETKSQVQADLIEKFQDFDEFEFIEAKENTSFAKTKKHAIVFISSQLLATALKPSAARRRNFLVDMVTGKEKIGMVFFDEAHKTGRGVETKTEIQKIIDAYSTLKLPFIFLTATYYNILFEYQIQKQNTFIWDYTDVLATRALATESEQESAIENLRKRFGVELVDTILENRKAKGESLETMAKAYVGFPDLFFLSADFQKEAITRFEEQNTYRPDSGFSLSSIFALRPDASLRDVKKGTQIRKDAYKAFFNLVNPRNMVSLLTPQDTFPEEGEGGTPLHKEEGSFLEPTILGRIDRLSSESKSRFRLDENPTLLMFMPTGGVGTNIFFLQAAWASLLMSHPWWNARYEVACVVADQSLSAENVAAQMALGEIGSDVIHIISDNYKSKIIALERKLQCDKGKGLVVLAGETLSMGISLPCTDVVFLFNEKKSPDDIIQKMYRALTPSEGKKSAFVVDLNPVRTLAALYGYTKASHEESNTPSELLGILYDSYSWDADVFEISLKKGPESKPLSFQDRLRQLFEQAETDIEYRINEDMGGFEKKLEQNLRKQIQETNPAFLAKIHAQFSGEKMKAAMSSLGLREDSKVELQKGKLVIRTRVPKAAEGAEVPPSYEEQEYSVENFIETVADFVKYLAITSTESTLDAAIVEFETNMANDTGSSLQKNVVTLIRGRTPIKGADDTLLINLLLIAVKDFAHSSSERIFRQMKGKIEEKSTRKTAILKIIHKHLTPKKKQKEEKGEVFTPVELVESMLEKLPKSVWKNPELKWLDPANGIGNFPVVAFYKLNEGLESWEPNENKRKKHIINNMLYMIEIQSNNSRIARNLFSKLCDDCKPNILTTDSLTMTSEKLKAKGWPEKYDIIMGNPPFNAGGILKGGGTLWPKFVKLAFDLVAENGFITFVHPPGWRKFYDPEDRENQGKIWYDIRDKGWNLDYINVSDKPPKHFPIVDYYVIHAKSRDASTRYDSEFLGMKNKGETELKLPFIPNMISEDSMKIIKKLMDAEGKQISIVYNQAFKPTVSDKGATGIPHYHFTNREGVQQIYKKQYTTIPEYINKKKVIMTFSGGYKKGQLFAFYTEEAMGTTNNSMYMIVDSKTEGEKLVKFFNSDIITFLMKITQYSASPNHKNEFKILNQLKMPDSLDTYNLTATEKELINKVNGIEEKEESVGGTRFNKTRKVKRT